MENLHHDSHQPGLRHHTAEETYKRVKILFLSISESAKVLKASASVPLHILYSTSTLFSSSFAPWD